MEVGNPAIGPKGHSHLGHLPAFSAPAGDLRMAADRASTDSLCGPLVSSVLAFVARRRRVARGTLFRGRPGKCATARHRRPFEPPRQLSNRMYEEAARLAERERSVTN